MSLGATEHKADFNNGEQIRLDTCRCGECDNEWWVRSSSQEFLPRFCPYCGIKFGSRTTDDVVYKTEVLDCGCTVLKGWRCPTHGAP